MKTLKAQILEIRPSAQESADLTTLSIFTRIFTTGRKWPAENLRLELPYRWDSRLTRRGTTHSRDLPGRSWLRESRRCSRDTYSESYITENVLIYEDYYPVGLSSSPYWRFNRTGVLLNLQEDTELTNDEKNATFEVCYFPDQNSKLTFGNDVEQLELSSSKTV